MIKKLAYDDYPTVKLKSVKNQFPSLYLIMLTGFLLIAGCSPDQSRATDDLYDEEIESGDVLWRDAQEFLSIDPFFSEELLKEAQDAFLRAAMIRPGDIAAAEKIAGITKQLQKTEENIETKDATGQPLMQKLSETVELLTELTKRQQSLAMKSIRMVRRNPAVSKEEKETQAAPSRIEQARIKSGTKEVAKTLIEMQSSIQDLLKKIYGKSDIPHPTEYDEPIRLLRNAQTSQETALRNLRPDQTNWQRVNGSFQGAKWQMLQALRFLSDQNRSQKAKSRSGKSNKPSQEDMTGENPDWQQQSDEQYESGMPEEEGNFQYSPDDRPLPSPNYTAEEILSEEAEYMKQRARHQAARAASKVEKDW